jgi:hypothetical protein
MPKAGSGLAGELGFKRRENNAAYYREWRKRNKEKQNAYAKSYYHDKYQNDPKYRAMKLEASKVARRKAKYNITRECYNAMLTAQGGKCIICNEHYGDELRVDHNHATGEIRGLLCSNCNSALGLFKEDPIRMQNAIGYVTKGTK